MGDAARGRAQLNGMRMELHCRAVRSPASFRGLVEGFGMRGDVDRQIVLGRMGEESLERPPTLTDIKCPPPGRVTIERTRDEMLAAAGRPLVVTWPRRREASMARGGSPPHEHSRQQLAAGVGARMPSALRRMHPQDLGSTLPARGFERRPWRD